MRLAWAPGRYEGLRSVGWQVLNVGPVAASLAAWAKAHQLPATELTPIVGETAGTVYLVRPDSYVGLVAATFSEAEFGAYAAKWAIGSEGLKTALPQSRLFTSDE